MMLCSRTAVADARASSALVIRPLPSVFMHTVVLIPGDGIGPEVTDAMRRVLSAAGAQINWIERHAGVAALERGGDSVLPADTMNAIVEHGVAIKGPCTTPIGGGFASI